MMSINRHASKPDRRKERTQQQLRTALTALILERGYDTITVQNITEKANLGRATFYLHFHDKEHLLLTGLQEVFDDLKQRIGPPSREHFLMGTNPAPRIIFEHVAENADLYRVMLQAQGAAGILRSVREYIAVNIQERLESQFPAEIEMNKSLLAQYMAGSLLSLIMWWLESDMPSSPDEMAHTFNRLMATGILGWLAEQGLVINSPR